MKTCKTCSQPFIGKGPASLYCDTCPRPSKSRDYQKAAQKKYHGKRGREVGVGSGNHSGNKGSASPGFINGWTAYKIRGRELKIERGNRCERCAIDLTNASRWQWVCHHKDHDRSNPADENLEILCKRCHQVEHQCWLAFEGATTIPKGSSPKQGEMVESQNGT